MPRNPPYRKRSYSHPATVPGSVTDLEQALRSPGGGVRLRDEAARIYEFPDGTVYHFTVRPVQDKYGIPYTEVMVLEDAGLDPDEYDF